MRRRVNSTPDIVEEACAIAWVQFLRSQPARERNWQGWLTTTAEREVWRLNREATRAVPLEIPGREDRDAQPADPRDRLSVRTDLRHALDLLATVPERRRRAKALHVIGLTYEEIGEVLGIRFSRVNRLITDANQMMRNEHTRVLKDGSLPHSEPGADPPAVSAASVGTGPERE